MDLVEGIARMAHTGDLRRILDCRRDRRKIAAHLLFGLDIEIIRWHLHAVRIAHSLSGLHAKKHFVRLAVFSVHVVAVVGRHERDPRLITEHDQMLVDLGLLHQLIALDLEIVVAAAEYAVIPEGRLLRLFRLVI